MGIANKSARTTGAPSPASQNETSRTVNALQRNLTAPTSSEAPKGKKIKTTKAVS